MGISMGLSLVDAYISEGGYILLSLQKLLRACALKLKDCLRQSFLNNFVTGVQSPAEVEDSQG